ncbi:MAG: hypothetical protein NC428_05830 [Clostridium sp.]|nr:hypothetical protein [Clostridium sp.]
MYEKLYNKAKELDLDVVGCLSNIISTEEMANKNFRKKEDMFFARFSTVPIDVFRHMVSTLKK